VSKQKNPSNTAHPIREGKVEKQAPGNGSRMVTTAFSGPLPSPDLLQHYEDIVPGLAADIVGWTTTQTAHRQQIENRAIGIDEKLSTWHIVERLIGQLFAFIIAISVLGTVIYLAMNGKETAAAAVGVIGFGGIISAFIYGRRQETPPPEEKPKGK
jgi:uncharacterized membrane protein